MTPSLQVIMAQQVCGPGQVEALCRADAVHVRIFDNCNDSAHSLPVPFQRLLLLFRRVAATCRG